MATESVLITGCSDGGIGSALALVFQQRGYHVFATARSPAKMSKLRDLDNVTLLTLDVVNPADIQAAANAVTKHTGGTLNYLINNAARNRFMPILDENLEEIKDLFDVNFIAPIAITQAFAPLLIKAKGSAVYITSISGNLNVPYMGTYSASKKSIEIVAETLRLELAPFGVNVTEIVTGAVVTNGQTYFGDFQLPPESLYKTIEGTIAGRAQGKDGLTRMDTEAYAVEVVDEVVKRSIGRVWKGTNADMVKVSTTAVSVPQSVMDAGALMWSGLDMLAR